jgi:hypothetical protein
MRDANYGSPLCSIFSVILLLSLSPSAKHYSQHIDLPFLANYYSQYLGLSLNTKYFSQYSGLCLSQREVFFIIHWSLSQSKVLFTIYNSQYWYLSPVHYVKTVVVSTLYNISLSVLNERRSLCNISCSRDFLMS